MDELDFNGKKYLSSKRAAEVTGYAKDYVGQLCREGRVEARLVGRAWYVSETSIREHRFGEEEPAHPETKIEVASEDPRMLRPKEVANTWGTSMYASEQIDLVPTLRVRSSVDVFSEEVAPQPVASPVHHMQSVWQDWFDQRKQSDVGENEGETTEVLFTKIEEERTEREDSLLEEAEPIIEETRVPIYKMPMREEPVYRAPEPKHVEPRSVAAAPTRKERVLRKPQRAQSSSFITQALLVALTLLVVSGTLLALGYGGDVLKLPNNFVVDYISGVSK